MVFTTHPTILLDSNKGLLGQKDFVLFSNTDVKNDKVIFDPKALLGNREREYSILHELHFQNQQLVMKKGIFILWVARKFQTKTKKQKIKKCERIYVTNKTEIRNHRNNAKVIAKPKNG